MRTCEVELPNGMCTRKHRAKGMCSVHYWRDKHYGDVRADMPIRDVNIDPPDTCTVVAPWGVCPREHDSKGMCKAHYSRWYRDGDVRADVPIASYITDAPTYRTIHNRIEAQRGRADEHGCVNCGGQAEQWSYDHTDPDERTSGLGCPYSYDLDRYDPRCRSCHTEFDLSRAGMEETHAPDLARTTSM